MRGAVAGTVATGLMSGVMLGASRLGITGELPPKKIASKLLDRGGFDPSEGQRNALASLLHVAFGAGAGAAFGVVAPRVSVPTLPLGIAYGAAIWGVSYMGWVPALGIMPPADDDRRGRQVVMFVCHLIYGAALGALAGRRASTD
jgi:uncharacterized membrane protein YagU involved in acid resistance